MFEILRNKAKCLECKQEINLNDMKYQEIKYCSCKGVKMRVVKYTNHFDISKGWYSEFKYF